MLKYVVTRLAFHCATEFATKFVPLIVIGMDAVPAPNVLGETLVMAGAAGAETVKFAEA